MKKANGRSPSLSPSNAFQNDPKVDMYPNTEGMGDVYVHKMGVVVQTREKKFIRIRWGNTAEIPPGRWVGFAPADWCRKRPLGTDPQLLGFFVKPNLCERSCKSKKQSGWVTLSIDGHRRAIKATIDGWTLGKVFIPTWLLGRIMRPVAISEVGTPITFDVDREEGCEKVLRSGFSRWSTTVNSQAALLLRCAKLNYSFEQVEQHSILGMTLRVKFDEEQNLQSIMNLEDGYISYDAVDRMMANSSDEIIPLVLNDRHAFRIKQRGLWDLFYSDGRAPLDYLSERMSALVRKIHVAKQRHNHKQFVSALTRLSHMRHILYFLAKDQTVVQDANNRVSWFLQNSSTSGTHKKFTPDLGQLLICMAVSDFDWEDIAIPFFDESLSRAIPEAVKGQPWLKWGGENCSSLHELFEALMIVDHSLSYNMLQVTILNHILKPHFLDLDEVAIERLSAEELCCGIAGLSEEFRILEYERSSRKDEIKKCLIKREWENEFSPEQWQLISPVLSDPARLRGMLHRARMIAECHGTCGLPTREMFDVINRVHEQSKTVSGFKEFLGCYLIEYPGDDLMFSILKKSILMAQAKEYMVASDSRGSIDEEGLVSARTTLSLKGGGDRGEGLFRRQKRPLPVYEPEILPDEALSTAQGTAEPTSTESEACEAEPHLETTLSGQISEASEGGVQTPTETRMPELPVTAIPPPSVHVPVTPGGAGAPQPAWPFFDGNMVASTPHMNQYVMWPSQPTTPGLAPPAMSPQVSWGLSSNGMQTPLAVPGTPMTPVIIHTPGAYATPNSYYYTFPTSAPTTPGPAHAHQYSAPGAYMMANGQMFPRVQ